MSLWGNADSAAITGNVDVTNGSATVAEGSVSTAFTTAGQIEAGDLVIIASVPYRIKSVESASSMTLTTTYAGSNDTNLVITKRETPRNLSVADSDAIFGVDTTEVSAGADNVVSIAVNSAGTGYASAPDVTVAGNTTSTATVASGKVTALSVTGTNTGHTSVPAVTIDPPVAKTFNGTSAVTVGTDTIALASHGFATGDSATYTEGATAITGLTTATTYYVIRVDANSLKLATSAVLSSGGTAINLTVVGSNDNHSLTGKTATAVASLGSGNYTHSGWIKRTAGTGGRAGRVQYETLVAGGSITGDTADDTEFPDA